MKKVHRLNVLIIVGLAAVMGATGSILKFPFLNPGFETGLVRYLHSQISPLFSLSLGAMVITGGYLYFYLLWAWFKKSRP